jgi:hypothetical protein
VTVLRAFASRSARQHILQKHGVHWYEVVEVLASGSAPRRGKDAGLERRYYVKGSTAAGRRLYVVIRLRLNGDAEVITAYEIKR